MIEIKGLKFTYKGGPGSGHHGHAGRPGQVGGSASGRRGRTYSSGEIADKTGEQLLKELGNEAVLNRYNDFKAKQSNGEIHDWAIWETMGQGRNYGTLYAHLYLPLTGQHWRGETLSKIGDFEYIGKLTERWVRRNIKW